MNHASRADSASSSVDERSARTFEGLRNLVAKVTPWLIDVGSWIFGGLTAINLVVMSALINAKTIARQIDAQGLLEKPFTDDELVETVGAFFRDEAGQRSGR